MLRLVAKIYFQTPNENGPSQDPASGIRPNFGFGDELITSEILSVDQASPTFIRGIWSLAEIRLPYGDVFDASIQPGMSFRITFGGRQVGRGTVEQILEIYRDPRNQAIRDNLQTRR